MGAVEIRREELSSPAASDLITALNAELSEVYPEPGATHFRLEAEEVAGGNGTFVVAYLDGEPVGCGALRRLDSHSGELKRMYVLPSARGRRIGHSILLELEDVARRLGLTRLVLETGDRQTEALKLYRRNGFAGIPAFGEYTDSPLSVCMGKDL